MIRGGNEAPPHGRLRARGLSSGSVQEFLSAIESNASAEVIESIPLPETYRAAYVRRADVSMFDGLDSADKDPRKSLQVGEVPRPELAPDEAYVAVMASAINFNTVWTSIFEPLPTFGFLDRLGKESAWGARHALDYHIVGSDASGVVLRTGSAVRNWKPGDRVTLRYSSGPRKVKEVLERMRITGSRRALWPVLEINGSIVWMKGVELEPNGELKLAVSDIGEGESSSPSPDERYVTIPRK